MTAKQLDLVRELRLYHTPSLFMEAAAELERLWLENAHQKEQLAIERERVVVQMANVAELRREIAENEKSLQYYMERDHEGSLR